MLLGVIIKFLSINCENLFLATEDCFKYQVNRKPEAKLKELARAIKNQNPDIILLSEVGGKASLTEFNKAYLDNKFTETLINGNSDRGIELGYLINKNLRFSFEHYTHKNRKIDFLYPSDEADKKIDSHLFSRDIAELRLIDDSKKVALIILGVHLKSQIDKDGQDAKGQKRRQAELKTLVRVYNKMQQIYPDTPIILSGDFNGNASDQNTSPEFQYLYDKSKLVDILALLNLPKEQRTTFVCFNKKNEQITDQLDYIFFEEVFFKKINRETSGIYRYQKADGTPWPLPQSNFERYQMPSDHYPVVLDFCLK